jgi:hypothetical protein
MPLIIRNPDGSTEGNPQPALRELEEAGHRRRSPMSVVRAKCQDCCAGSLTEVRWCTAVGCALWPNRMGSSPFRARSTRPGRFARKIVAESGDAGRGGPSRETSSGEVA